MTTETVRDQALLSPGELQPATALANRILMELDRILLGRTDVHRLVLIGLLSRGHLLLEGLPGLGKTAMIKAIGDILGLQFRRVQFTPDLMPGDILGTHILQQTGDGHREMVFHPGPAFANILLADEINRASPKTQSALLEAMQERRVTLMGTTRPLPEPFFVLASQNPIELEGTYPLPEAQLDRFLFRLIVPALGPEVLQELISTRRRGETPTPGWTVGRDELAALFAAMDRIYLPTAVARYVARLVAATHADGAEAPTPVREYVQYGASPRAAIAMAESARAHAMIAGRPSVGFEDVRAVAAPVLNHRVLLGYRARLDRVTSTAVVGQLLDALEETGSRLPTGATLLPSSGEAPPQTHESDGGV